LGIKNTASNEDIRSRWNGSACNEQTSRIFRDDCSVFDKIKHIFWSELPESKLDLYIKLVEVQKKLNEFEKQSSKSSLLMA